MWWLAGLIIYFLFLFAGILFLRAGAKADRQIHQLAALEQHPPAPERKSYQKGLRRVMRH